MAKRYLLFLFFIVASALAASELVIRYYVMDYHRLAQQVYKILNSNEQSIIIGDSHTKASFRNVPEGFVNLSVEGMNVMMFDSILKSYASRNEVKQAIVLASPHIFSKYRVDGNAGIYEQLPQRSLNWFDEFYVFNSVYQAALFDTIKWKIMNVLHAEDPISLVKTRAMQLLGQAPVRLIKEEIRQKNVDWKDQDIEQQTRDTERQMYDHAPTENFEEHPFAKTYKEMIDRLISSGTRVCLIRTPVSEVYDNMYKEKFGLDSMDAFFETIVQKLNNQGKITYVSYKNLNIDFPDQFLLNTDHLNEEGSELFVPAAVKACDIGLNDH